MASSRCAGPEAAPPTRLEIGISIVVSLIRARSLVVQQSKVSPASSHPVAPSRATAGRVKNQHTMVAHGRQAEVEGEAATDPTLSTNSTTAARNDTKSAARIVRHVALKPRVAELRIVRPLRTSSFRRSKYTT